MLFVAKINIYQSGPEKEWPVVVLSVIGKNSFTNKDILNTPNVLENLGTQGQILKVDFVDKTYVPIIAEVPLVVVPEGSNIPRQIDVTPFLRMYSTIISALESGEDVVTKLSEKLTNHYKYEINVDTITTLLYALRQLDEFTKGKDPVRVVVPPVHFRNPSVTASKIKDYNSRQGFQFTALKTENRTLKMDNEDEEFFIEIPTYERLQSPHLSIDDLIPSLKDVFEPYPHVIYHTPFYRDVQGTISPERRKYINSYLEELSPLNKSEREYYPKINFTLVEGTPLNNDLEIQENEMSYYNALKEFIMYDISQTHPDLDVEEAYKKGIVSSRLLEYLKRLSVKLVRYNWTHSNQLTYEVGSLDDSDDDTDNERNEDKDTFGNDAYFRYDENDLSLKTGLYVFEAFVESSKTDCGMDAYVEAIIKLSRWGKNKPTRLRLCDQNLYLDLNTFTVRSTSGSIASMEPLTVNGCSLQLRGVVLFSGEYKSKKWAASIGYPEGLPTSFPVGISATRYFPGDQKQIVYISLLELVTELYSGNNNNWIDGVRLVDGEMIEITIPEGVELLEESLSSCVAKSLSGGRDSMYIINTSKDVREVKFTTTVEGITIIDILNKYLYEHVEVIDKPDLTFFKGGKDGFMEKVVSTGLPPELIIKTEIAKLILPIYFESAKTMLKNDIFEFTSMESITSLLNWIKDIVKKNNYRGVMDLFSAENAREVISNTKNTLSRMQTFNTTKETTKVETDIKEDTSEQLQPLEEIDEVINSGGLFDFLIESIPTKSSLYSLVYNNVVVGGLYVSKAESGTLYTFVGKNDISKDSLVLTSRRADMSLIVHHLLSLTYLVLESSDVTKIKLRFHSKSSVEEAISTMLQIYRESIKK